MRARRGFTLIELMIVASIISVLAAIAVPKFGDMLRKANEGSTKGNLGAIRSALTIYYGDMEGQYPTCAWGANSNVLNSALVPKYLAKVPDMGLPPYHGKGNRVHCHHDITTGHTHDGEVHWTYRGNNMGAGDTTWSTTWGNIIAACAHTDMKGTNWSGY